VTGEPLDLSCDAAHHCVTCSDEGTPMRVREPGAAAGLAVCVTVGEDGRDLPGADAAPQEVETALVGKVAAGEVVLVHAGVALTRLDGAVSAGVRAEAAA